MPELPEEAVQAAIDGVDHEYVERHGFDHNAARAALTAATPVLAAHVRREAAEQIAREIESATPFHWTRSQARAWAAGIARSQAATLPPETPAKEET